MNSLSTQYYCTSTTKQLKDDSHKLHLPHVAAVEEYGEEIVSFF